PVVVHVERDLDPAALRKREPDRADPRAPSARFPQLRGDAPRELYVVACEIDVERHERGARGDEDGAAAGIDGGRPVIRLELTGRRPARELIRAALPERGPLAAVVGSCEVAIEEHREPELRAD